MVILWLFLKNSHVVFAAHEVYALVVSSVSFFHSLTLLVSYDCSDLALKLKHVCRLQLSGHTKYLSVVPVCFKSRFELLGALARPFCSRRRQLILWLRQVWILRR